jgi:hypothetical protein
MEIGQGRGLAPSRKLSEVFTNRDRDEPEGGRLANRAVPPVFGTVVLTGSERRTMFKHCGDLKNGSSLRGRLGTDLGVLDLMN